MSDFQTWKETMGFNPSWHQLYLSPLDKMVCIARGSRKHSEGKENFLEIERIHSTKNQLFMKATVFLLCIKRCVT